MSNRNIVSVTLCSTISDVYKAIDKGRAFRAMVRFRGYTDKGNSSNKFWEISGRGNGQVTVRWGRVGSAGRSQEIPSYEAIGRLHEKVGKGYRFAEV
jgi:predicted DNA-binding WGR domain protein